MSSPLRIIKSKRCWIYYETYGELKRFKYKTLYFCLEDEEPLYDGEEVELYDCELVFNTYIMKAEHNHDGSVPTERYFGIRRGCTDYMCLFCIEVPFDCQNKYHQKADMKMFRQVGPGERKTWFPKAPSLPFYERKLINNEATC